MNQELRIKNYEPVIGLEVHVELKTKSKMFCSCSADYFGKKPNTYTCPVCLGLPGALPAPNKTAIEWCLKIGAALNCELQEFSKFDRKNYFYPDLPKGYQISQYDEPFCKDGYVNIDDKSFRIRRVHMEEDTAKLVHQFGNQRSKIKNQNDEDISLIDFNRSGVPLVEIVTEPDFNNSGDVKTYLKLLQQTVRYLEVSDADMERGDMRLEPNISIRESIRSESQIPNYKVEVKNINSFKFVEKAIDYEIERQIELLKTGQKPVQETRGWDENKQKTVSQRIKEEASDYRYFPEPDIPPFRFSKERIAEIECEIPEMPEKIIYRFQNTYALSHYDSEILSRDKKTAEYFDEAVKIGFHNDIKAKEIANAIINKKNNIKKVLPAQLVKQIKSNKQISAVDEKELEKVITEVLKVNEKAVSDFKKGQKNAIMFLVGAVMRSLKVKADAQKIKASLLAKIK